MSSRGKWLLKLDTPPAERSPQSYADGPGCVEEAVEAKREAMALTGKAEAEERRERRRTKGTKKSMVGKSVVELIFYGKPLPPCMSQ